MCFKIRAVIESPVLPMMNTAVSEDSLWGLPPAAEGLSAPSEPWSRLCNPADQAPGLQALSDAAECCYSVQVTQGASQKNRECGVQLPEKPLQKLFFLQEQNPCKNLITSKDIALTALKFYNYIKHILTHTT